VPSLLVTNDFPPKHGGIQSYLYELWRRLPPDETTVLTTAFDGAKRWDAEQSFRVERVEGKVLLPTPAVRRRIRALVAEVQADVVFVDPMLPLGLLGPDLDAGPYVVVAHGAEVTGYGRLPGTKQLARRVLRHAAAVVAAGGYPAEVAAAVAGRDLRGVQIPPGVDADRFRVLDDAERDEARRSFGLPVDGHVVLGLSRLVPRKGFDVMLDAVAELDDSVTVALAGHGRDRRRLEARADRIDITSRVRFLGRVPDADLPALYGCADVFAMLCRDRWGGLEAEGFGIVFLEAAACGVPAVAGRSGGSHEAVAHDSTGYVVDPRDVDEVRDALHRLLSDDELRARMGKAARRRAEDDYSYDALVERLRPVAKGTLDSLGLLATDTR
jgi:phosphatidylinositol alpha-1,6-mannosyltransferase